MLSALDRTFWYINMIDTPHMKDSDILDVTCSQAQELKMPEYFVWT